jgi:flagellar biosynthetic protein FliR
MNIFMISLPLNVGLGLMILGMTLTIFFHVLEVSFGQLSAQIDALFRLMVKGG